MGRRAPSSTATNALDGRRDMKKVAGSNWIHIAQCLEKWKMLKEAYTNVVETGLRRRMRFEPPIKIIKNLM
ncbi:jg23434 [Pararge aegeria aegeria]|uniref:Jg23434 protein n=1 Tax=Pararge aegeria aegeria TaxID=348720 RepID=A0A8S4S240_9NEOP|nr:jg23434 [Pararge aegeria aegeria]